MLKLQLMINFFRKRLKLEDSLNKHLQLLYRIGLYGLGWFAGTLSGVLTVFSVHNYFVLRGTYESYADGRFPDYANAAVNVLIRLPLWVLGTLLFTTLLMIIHPAKQGWKKLLLLTLYLIGYFVSFCIAVFIGVFFRPLDVFFSGFTTTIIFPAVFVLILSVTNIFRVKLPLKLEKKDFVWIGLGGMTLFTVIVYILIALPLAIFYRFFS